MDYKLCARVLAGRLLKVIHQVVASDQTCGVPGRLIGENVALLRDVATFASETDTLLALLSLDQEKAFDHIDLDWGFLLAVLCRMGFGPSFVNWVKLLHTDFIVPSLLMVILLIVSFLREECCRVAHFLLYSTSSPWSF